MINFAICDDNDILLSKSKELLESIFLKHDFTAMVTYVSNNINDLLLFLSSNKIDVLFLDIDLNSKYNGIDLAKKIRQTNKEIYIIFVTGHFEYILSAYECKTFDFIQKPFTYTKLEKTVIRLFDDINKNNTKFISISGKHQLINESLIDYIEKDGMKMYYNTKNERIESYDSFSNVLSFLPSNFVRCHKSFIVNIQNISNINFKNNTINFSNSNNTCFIGPKYKENFMGVINKNGNIK